MALPANTKSTTTTETVRGEHRFDIAGYCVKHHAGRVLTSETFAVGGLDWAISYHPAGAEVGDEEYVSVFVRLVTPNASARALYDLRLVDRATGLPRSVRRRREPVAFEASKAKKRERGSRMFMTLSELAASPYLRDDRLTVECVLDVVQTLLSETTASPGTAEPPPPDLSRHLGALLLRTPVGADVTVTVQGEAFRAHRVVLAARSPVLKAELSGSAPAKEDDDASEVVAVDGMAPPVFKTLLHFIYTDTLPDDLLGDLGREEHQELVRDLLAGADRFGMNRLKQICQLVLNLGKPLDAKTVAAALDPSGQHRHCQALGVGDGCVQFMPSA
jgi:speckle-type POZ protein